VPCSNCCRDDGGRRQGLALHHRPGRADPRGAQSVGISAGCTCRSRLLLVWLAGRRAFRRHFQMVNLRSDQLRLAPSTLAAARYSAAQRLCRGVRPPGAASAPQRGGRSSCAKSHHSASQHPAYTGHRPYVTPHWPPCTTATQCGSFGTGVFWAAQLRRFCMSFQAQSRNLTVATRSVSLRSRARGFDLNS
jgi:hypothetical protein